MLRLSLVVCLGVVGCSKSGQPRASETYHAQVASTVVSPSGALRPSPVASPKGTEVGNQPVPAASTPPPSQVGPPQPQRVYGGGIGADCTDATSCVAPAGICFADYPGGQCSLPCSRLCPDAPGQSTTFCIADRSGTGGICVAKCTQNSDCRTGYSCQSQARFNEPDATDSVCLPAELDEKSCESEFAVEAGLPATPWSVSDDQAQLCSSSVDCTVNAPIQLPDTMNNVAIVKQGDDASASFPVSCRMAQSLLRMTMTLSQLGVSQVVFNRLYSCESISGTEQPHALGDAPNVPGILHAHGESIDIVSMTIGSNTFDVGGSWGTYESPASSDQRQPLLGVLNQLKQDHIFYNVYTPYCNPMFDGFFHADLAPGSADEMLNPAYQLDDPSLEVCSMDFPTTCD